VNSACASGADALGVAHTLITSGRLDMVIVGGADAVVNTGSILGFNHLMALSERNDEPERASRPFDKNRSGFVMGEGGGLVILESEEHALSRGAQIICEHVGYASTNEASNIMQPKEGGVGMGITMSAALEDAGMAPEEIQYVSAHGTSTGHNDRCESQGIRRAFGEHADKLAVSSQKSMVGHSLGAAGAIEFVVTALSIAEDFATPTINYETPDPDCNLDYVPNQGRSMVIDGAISNSFGFGGHNVSHVLRKYRR
jgi:3-oxoacyl-[acyl-carrier-protein] synthase II